MKGGTRRAHFFDGSPYIRLYRLTYNDQVLQDDQTIDEREIFYIVDAPLVKVKVKVDTIDIAPLRSESPPQKRSGMARVLKGFHSFYCTPTRSSAIGMSHTCLCLPSRSWYSFTDPGGMEG